MLRLVLTFDTYLIRSHLFFLSEVYDLFLLLCILSSVLICCPPEVIFHTRVVGACPVTADCVVAMSLFEIKY